MPHEIEAIEAPTFRFQGMNAISHLQHDLLIDLSRAFYHKTETKQNNKNRKQMTHTTASSAGDPDLGCGSEVDQRQILRLHPEINKWLEVFWRSTTS